MMVNTAILVPSSWLVESGGPDLLGLQSEDGESNGEEDANVIWDVEDRPSDGKADQKLGSASFVTGTEVDIIDTSDM
jgi:hypothetical protein